MEVLKKISGTAAVLDIDNIDTDQIIPAEYLKITNKDGLGEHLFSNWRYLGNSELEREKNADFVLNKSETKDAKILIAGDNFGCGSSREHAPWALVDFGIRVVVSSSIADIFRNNSIKNGLLPIVVSKDKLNYLKTQNAQEINVDIENQTIVTKDKLFEFDIEPFGRYCFLNGMDQLDFILSKDPEIAKFESSQKVYSI